MNRKTIKSKSTVNVSKQIKDIKISNEKYLEGKMLNKITKIRKELNI